MVSMNKTITQLPSPPAENTQTSEVELQTSRIFVSGLPPKLTSDQLAAHFSSQFDVTDAHVIAERRIGFVGFRDTLSAQNAAKHFNKSYIRLSKITVDLARPVHYSRDGAGKNVPTSERDYVNPTSVANKKRRRLQKDDGESERAEATRPTRPTQIATVKEVTSREDKIVDHDDTQDVVTAATDKDWLRGKTTRTLDLIDPDDIEDIEVAKHDTDTAEDKIEATAQQQEEELNDNKIKVPNARLFVRNLAYSTTEDDLNQLFEPLGKVQEVHLVKDSRSFSSKGAAFIQFAESSEAEAALSSLDGTTFQGRLLHILPAADKRDQGLTDFDISQMPLKKQRAIRRKLEASKATFSWNSLYMNPDAILSSIADRLGVAKADILDPTSADAAVKQAHAESQLIKETKQHLASNGVNVEAFKNRARDDRCLLLKNFPYGTTEIELKTMLEPYGMIRRFILPPSGTMALVQFNEAYSASEALKNLSYKNIKGSVLYLEKGPHGILDVSENTPTLKGKSHDEVAPSTSTVTSTVFVKNLNFLTTDARLIEIASALPGFVSARIKTRTEAKRPGEVLSMGFGFIEFSSIKAAESAAAALNGHRLDGHELKTQLSTRNLDAGEETRRQDQQRKAGANQTKIIIKNLPFQASKKDIRSLFAQYGDLKRVRVPRKFDNTTRGFAFAEFVTPKEAENAMNALANTHLLGRRLVLDFAENDTVDPEEEIKAIEKKVEQQSNRIHLNNLRGSGRKRFNLNTAPDDDLHTFS